MLNINDLNNNEEAIGTHICFKVNKKDSDEFKTKLELIEHRQPFKFEREENHFKVEIVYSGKEKDLFRSLKKLKVENYEIVK